MNVLSIAGSDPSSGAGIQGDIKTFQSHGVYGLCVVTAVTSQNTSKFFDVKPVAPSFVKSQIKSILEDFKVEAIKIGMVYNKQTIQAIHSELKNIKIPIILDPIFNSTTGGILQMSSALKDFKKFLIPMSYVITPNTIEAQKITRIKIKSINDMKNAAIKIQEMGAKNVIIKGGHLVENDKITDILLAGKRFHTYHHERMSFDNHGGGCTFSASLCANIAIGKDLANATDSARLFTIQSMKNSVKIGRGVQITSIRDEIENELHRAITEFCSIPSISEHIPECQTNFVYSKLNPSSLKDIMGLEGRIVKTGRVGTVAGNLKYGGSKHVASAVLEMTKKFPSFRSGINLKYDERIIRKAMTNGLKIASYDRNKETQENKEREGSTISWGIKTAISESQVAPDIVFHKGDFGKEAMIIVFGRNPEDVLKKTLKITQIHPST